MRMTKRNKEWLNHALYYGENGLYYDYFYDTGWEAISAKWGGDEDGLFHQLYVKYGGDKDDRKYVNDEAAEKAIDAAHFIMTELLLEVRRRMGVKE